MKHNVLIFHDEYKNIDTQIAFTVITDCGLLNNQSNGAVDISAGTLYKNLATYKCSGGYTLNGTSTRTCQANGQWSGSEPSCIPVDCGALMPPSNGIVSAPNGTTYSNQVEYICETGYTVVGNGFRTCQSNGQWSGSEPSCFVTGIFSLLNCFQRNMMHITPVHSSCI